MASDIHTLGNVASHKTGRSWERDLRKVVLRGLDWEQKSRPEIMNRESNCEIDRAEVRSQSARLPINLKINGHDVHVEIAPWVTLLDLLRERLNLTGTKKGCDHGQCGACTVLVNGKRINSCMTLAVMQDGGEITSIEGLLEGGEMHRVQQAFVDCDAFQCGYCTPGQICSAIGLMREGRAKTSDDIRELMSGNLCRCGAYPNILAAIEQAMHDGAAR